MTTHYFVCGTDTGVGKTVAVALLARYAKSLGRRVSTIKWVQTGTDLGDQDVSVHRRLVSGSGFPPLLTTTCYNLGFPASPHLAAEKAGRHIDISRLSTSLQDQADDIDITLVEGSGGLLVPVDRKTLLLDIAQDLSLPCILVVGNRLGCINHTLLSVAELVRRDMTCLGLIFSEIDDSLDPDIAADNRQTILSFTGLPLLAEIPRFHGLDQAEFHDADGLNTLFF